jgi:hypothetical protein
MLFDIMELFKVDLFGLVKRLGGYVMILEPRKAIMSSVSAKALTIPGVVTFFLHGVM